VDARTEVSLLGGVIEALPLLLLMNVLRVVVSEGDHLLRK